IFHAEYPNAKITFVTSGKKGAEFLKRTGREVSYIFPAYSLNPKFSDIFSISKIALKGYEKEDFDKVVMVYPDFVSTLIQKPVVRTLLPFSPDIFERMLEELGSKFSKFVKPADTKVEYKLEPSPEYILKNILPQLTEMQLYQAILEAAASEHSARMVAMQNANKAAKDLLDDLVLTYNQARQSAITSAIAEIASSSIALS
ncbi:MAG: F0F1 ATP synthase subunit gamma, partial [Candidatus Gracilibacteria bacterium]